MTPTSQTQVRVLKLIGRDVPASYEEAKSLLEAAGLPGDAIPRGETWRSVKKFSDAELLAALKYTTAENDERRAGREEYNEVYR